MCDSMATTDTMSSGARDNDRRDSCPSAATKPTSNADIVAWISALLQSDDVQSELARGGGGAAVVAAVMKKSLPLETRSIAAFILGQLAQELPQVHRYARQQDDLIPTLLSLIATVEAPDSGIASVRRCEMHAGGPARGRWVLGACAVRCAHMMGVRSFLVLMCSVWACMRHPTPVPY